MKQPTNILEQLKSELTDAIEYSNNQMLFNANHKEYMTAFRHLVHKEVYEQILKDIYRLENTTPTGV